jgi:hypothetical protein
MMANGKGGRAKSLATLSREPKSSAACTLSSGGAAASTSVVDDSLERATDEAHSTSLALSLSLSTAASRTHFS